MMIAVEGMDGVGKTEISKYIAKEHGFTFIEKPLHYFYNDGPENGYADLMNTAKRLYGVDDSIILSWYISLGNIYVARMFNNENVVIDRHLVSNYYWNGNEESNPIFEAIIKTSGVPDLTILLYATPQTRMDRLRKRNKDDPDIDDIEKQDDGYDKMVYFLEMFNIPHVIINTENKSLDEVKKIVDEEILKIKPLTRKLVNKKEGER